MQGHRQPRRRIWGALAVSTVMVLAACSDDEASSETTKAPAGTDATDTTTGGGTGESMDCGLGNGQAATGDPIVLGAVVGATGPADFSSASQGAQAYFDCVNANGGINGRPIEYKVEDDGWDPEKAVTVAKKLVEDDQIGRAHV